MDFNITLVGIVILLVVFVPVFYMIFIASGSTKKAKKAVSELLKTNNANADTIEVIGNTVIGLDSNSKKLIYAKKQNPKELYQIFDIDDLKSIQARIRKRSDKSVIWVGLELSGKSENSEIPMYIDDSDEDSAKDPEACFQDAIRWEKQLQPLLT